MTRTDIKGRPRPSLVASAVHADAEHHAEVNDDTDIPRRSVGDFTLPDYPVEARGIYVCRWLSRTGNHVLFAVDSRGRYAGDLIVYDQGVWNEGAWDAASEKLRAHLDKVDPVAAVPRLGIVQ